MAQPRKPKGKTSQGKTGVARGVLPSHLEGGERVGRTPYVMGVRPTPPPPAAGVRRTELDDPKSYDLSRSELLAETLADPAYYASGAGVHRDMKILKRGENALAEKRHIGFLVLLELRRISTALERFTIGTP
ncbi:hypothetical protein Pan44_28070 [Caulifigura coniformis]|uniref:Uncharacterized protein n=1 Tax=Caulifigura coniformis TaxID=2527983 RepID=A0A517SFB1_9PLAN|nr:hypothetical protein Pan44_28070 [Caulifigura coniformis]